MAVDITRVDGVLDLLFARTVQSENVINGFCCRITNRGFT